MSLKKGQIYEGIVTDYSFPNKGRIDIDGQIVSVKGALLGQKVRFSISRKRTGVSEGRLKEVIERSPLENRTPSCPHFGKCGGCTYQKLAYEDQLDLKARMVRSLIERVYAEFIFEGIISSPDIQGYRNKMEFTFGDESKGGTFALGLHKKDSFHDIVNITQCSLVHRDINLIRNAVRDYFNDLYINNKVDFHHKLSHSGYLRHLLIRRSVFNNEIIVALVTASPSADGKPVNEEEQSMIQGFVDCVLSLERKGLLEGKIAGICHVYNDSASDVVKSDRTDILYGRDYIMESILGLVFRISLFSFFQTNSKGCEKLYEKAREYAAYDGGGVIYDLYSGTGTIAQIMSPAASEVCGIEIVEDAVKSAIENAQLNNISNVRFIAGDVMKILCGEDGESIPKPDMIILDPPREGIHPKALGRILGYDVEKIVYISCKPTSLANDLAAFKQAGYSLEKVCCVDMFPETVHVESCVLLERVSSRKADSYVKLNVKMEDYYRIKDGADAENAEE